MLISSAIIHVTAINSHPASYIFLTSSLYRLLFIDLDAHQQRGSSIVWKLIKRRECDTAIFVKGKGKTENIVLERLTAVTRVYNLDTSALRADERSYSRNFQMSAA